MYNEYEINDCIKHINLDNMHLNIGFNSFENLLCEKYPEIVEILGILRKMGMVRYGFWKLLIFYIR